MRAEKVVKQIASDPYSYKELTGRFKELHSARFGDHRIIYSINEPTGEIVLLALEARGTVYKY
jgi:mRNA-degrading endonuclease RelE of RelBE toxin-antitoxin system